MGLAKRIRGISKAIRIVRHQIDSHRISHMSESEKREYIAGWAERAGIKTFVETGTYLGKTVRFMSGRVDRCYSIELSQDLYEAAKSSLARHQNISLYCGDSAEILPAILKEIDQPALFWLDAHYSSGKTAGGKDYNPIAAELRAIFDHPVKDHLVLIDDAREFIGMNGYPTIRQMRKLVSSYGDGYTMIINNDIIAIYREDI